MSKNDLSKLAEKFEKKIAQQAKGKIAPPFKPAIAPGEKPMANENIMDMINEAHYVSLAISSLFKELGIDMNQAASRGAITQENADRFVQRIKSMLPNLRAVLDRLSASAIAVPSTTPIENPYE